jgi:hypothetical protein
METRVFTCNRGAWAAAIRGLSRLEEDRERSLCRSAVTHDNTRQYYLGPGLPGGNISVRLESHRNPTETPLSFTAQCRHGLHFGCPPRRKVAGEKRHDTEQNCRRSIGHYVRRRNGEQSGAQDSRCGQRYHQPES